MKATDIMRDITTQIYINGNHKLIYEFTDDSLLVISVIYYKNGKEFLEVEWVDKEGNAIISKTVDFDDFEATECAINYILACYDEFKVSGISLRI